MDYFRITAVGKMAQLSQAWTKSISHRVTTTNGILQSLKPEKIASSEHNDENVQIHKKPEKCCQKLESEVFENLLFPPVDFLSVCVYIRVCLSHTRMYTQLQPPRTKQCSEHESSDQTTDH